MFDGNNATLLDAYGGCACLLLMCMCRFGCHPFHHLSFEISMLPGYYAAVGAGWLERGGVKVRCVERWLKINMDGVVSNAC